MKYHFYDVVRLKCPKDGLVPGVEGTIVMAYEFPREGYDVEFSDLSPECSVVTLFPEELALVASSDGGAGGQRKESGGGAWS
ncbi:MAG: DUF4926 domain-containing protein [Acidobacteria bacterium]|nr:DUF4926 domain-containing protein [Acidobacteriota bacterium]